MKIEIKVRGNPGLYRSLQDNFARKSTTHRTFTGAARRLVRLNAMARTWGETTGNWGGWEIIVDGLSLHQSYSEFDIWCDPSPYDARRDCEEPVSYIAAALKARFEEISK